MGKYIFDAPAHHILDLTEHGVEELIHGGEEFVADLIKEVEDQLKGSGVRSVDESAVKTPNAPTSPAGAVTDPAAAATGDKTPSTSSAPGKPEDGATKP